jgi:hypothetical protein
MLQMMHKLQVVELVDLSVEQKQKMYLRFTKELFILNQLKHARVVPVYACTATLDELTLVMKVSSVSRPSILTVCIVHYDILQPYM